MGVAILILLSVLIIAHVAISDVIEEKLKERVDDLENETHQLMNETKDLFGESNRTMEKSERFNSVVKELARQKGIEV